MGCGAQVAEIGRACARVIEVEHRVGIGLRA